MSSKQDQALRRSLKKKNYNKEVEDKEPELIQKGKFEVNKKDKTHCVESKEKTLKLKKFRARKEHFETYETQDN